MPESQPNQIARTAAVISLVGAFLLVVILIATSAGGSGDEDGGDSGGDTSESSSGPTNKGQRAIDNGVWVVGEGDTLVSIAEETGIDIDELLDLNPEIDPQVLVTGQRISLRAGAAGDEDSSRESDAPGTTTSGVGTGEGDGGPTGPGSGISDGIDSN